MTGVPNPEIDQAITQVVDSLAAIGDRMNNGQSPEDTCVEMWATYYACEAVLKNTKPYRVLRELAEQVPEDLGLDEGTAWHKKHNALAQSRQKNGTPYPGTSSDLRSI